MTFAPQLLESGRARFARWALAVVVVCAVHIGGAALALLHWPEDEEPDEVAGALVLELAPLPAITPVDSPDVAHGPLMEEAVLTPQAKELVEEVQEDIPPLESSPAPEPDVALPKPQPVEKEQPKEETAEEAAREEQNPEQASAAPLTTAPPRVEAEPAPSSAPPSPARSASLARAQMSWQKALVKHLNHYKRYPAAARSRRAQGTVIVAFKINRAGEIVASHVTQSSGSSALDKEALAVLQRASPLPVPPANIAAPMLDLLLPIQFRIR